MLPTDVTYALDPGSRVFWQHLGTAVLCGGLIGIERQLRGKAAGIRTSILICLGTSIFVSLGASTAGERRSHAGCSRRSRAESASSAVG